MRAAWGRSGARLPLVLPPLVLALLLQGGAAADMAYSEPMRLQSPPEWRKSLFCLFASKGASVFDRRI